MPIPHISVILPVYNKENYLSATLASLHAQQGRDRDFALEFVLVDDASTDDSVAVAEAFFCDHPATVQILRNEKNAGPSVRLNQGLRAATGSLVFIFDADDIAPRNVLSTLLREMQSRSLDYIYGRSQKTNLSAAEAMAQALPDTPKVDASDDPLGLTLARGIVLPIVLARHEVVIGAGGCDDRVFVQDESLALRLALFARRAGLVEHPCRYVLVTPEEAASGTSSAAHVSANVAQAHHDQYLTYKHLLDDPRLTSDQRVALTRKAVSPWWKSVRKQGGSPAVLGWYLLSRAFPLYVLARQRERIHAYFAALPNVRRIA